MLHKLTSVLNTINNCTQMLTGHCCQTELVADPLPAEGEMQVRNHLESQLLSFYMNVDHVQKQKNTQAETKSIHR